MSKHQNPSLLAVIDRALGNQRRTARLQSLLITATCCAITLVGVFVAVIALSEGRHVLSIGSGAAAVLVWLVSKAARRLTVRKG